MALLKTIPSELLHIIFDYSEPHAIFNLSEWIDPLSYMRKRAHTHSKLKTNKYDLEQLVRICKLPGFSNVITSHSMSFVITDKGEFYYFGNGIKSPILYSNPNNIVQIAANDLHILFLTNDGCVYSCKRDRKNMLHPEIISELSNIIQIATGSNHTLALTIDGNVYGFGNNSAGQLRSDVCDKISLITIQNIPKICSVAAGDKTSFLLTDDGLVYSFGDNTYGQLGHDMPTGEKYLFQPDEQYIPCIITPKLIPNMKHIKQISAQTSGCALLTHDGDVYKFGTFTEEDAEVSYGLIASGLKSISLNYHHLLGITYDNKVYSRGYNVSGQMGLENLDVEEEIMGIIPGLENIFAISAGGYHSLVSTLDGKIYAFGENDQHELGIPDIDASNTPILLSF